MFLIIFMMAGSLLLATNKDFPREHTGQSTLIGDVAGSVALPVAISQVIAGANAVAEGVDAIQAGLEQFAPREGTAVSSIHTVTAATAKLEEEQPKDKVLVAVLNAQKDAQEQFNKSGQPKTGFFSNLFGCCRRRPGFEVAKMEKLEKIEEVPATEAKGSK